MAIGDVIGRLSVVLGLDTAGFETGARRTAKTTADMGDGMEKLGARVGFAAKAMVGLGAAMAGSQLVQQVKDMAIAGFEHASALGEQAQQLGVTTGELQKYRFIATQVGIEQAEMDKGLSRLSITLGDLANGAKGPMEALQRLGFSQEEIARISKMTAGEAIPFLADGFAKLKSPAESASIANDLFGKSIGSKFQTLLMGGSAALNTFTESYKRLGIELSPEQIAKADGAIDKITERQKELQAKTSKIAIDNAEGILAGLDAWDRFKLGVLEIVGELVTAHDSVQASWDKLMERFGRAVDGAKVHIGAAVKTMTDWFAKLGSEASASMQRLYVGVKTWLGDKLNSVWTWVIGKIETVKNTFFNLYDAVVGHSYVPDMVDGIADQMARLDRVMVDPAKKATTAVAGFFKDLDRDVRGFMDELFPGSRDMADFQNKLAKFDEGIRRGGAGGFNTDQLRAGRSQLIGGADPATLRGTPLPLADQLARFGNIDLGKTDGITSALKSITDAANDNADDLGIANVRIAKSFKDMADQTLSALDRMAGAVKGGGFLDILGAVIGLGLQLGSIGAFGKNIQTNINKPSIPGFAGGTSFAPGGLALVGERGPELVNLPRGSQVIPNHALNGGGGGNTYHFSGNLMTPDFWAQIQQGDMRAAAAGAQGGAARVFNSQRRRVA